MYYDFYGLRLAPFDLTPDPDFLYLTAQHREAVAGLAYALLARKGFVVLTGEAGTGKTTLLRRVLGSLPTTRVQSAVILNPSLTPSEFLEAVLLEFGLKDTGGSKTQRIAALQSFLWEAHRDGKVSAIIVDEAHQLSPELLEEIRMLGNFETAKQKLLQIVLVGQREMDKLLDRDEVRAFKQRIAMWLTLDPLPAAEVAQYIRHRWLKSGGKAAPFTPEAVTTISQASQGLPRLINVICDNALMQAFGERSARVEPRHVAGVCRDLRIGKPLPQQAADTPLVAAASFASVPALPVEPIAEEYPMKTLERYTAAGHHPSMVSRLATRLGITQRTETA